MKLKTRLIVLNLGVILLIASIIMGSLLVSSYKSIKEKSVETIELTATTVASEMETIIDQAAVDTKAIAKLMGEL